MFGKFRTFTAICHTEDELDNLLAAHYIILRQSGLTTAVRNSYEVKAVLGGTMTNQPGIAHYEVSIPLWEWEAIQAKVKNKDTLKQIVSGEYNKR